MLLNSIQPQGTSSYSGKDALALRAVQHWLDQLFHYIGATPYVLSSLVSYQNASDWLGLADEQRMRFVDRHSGDVVSLRADLTTQLLQLAPKAVQQTVCAQGSVFSDQLGQRRERNEATIEILYASNPSQAHDALLGLAQVIVQQIVGPEYITVLGSTSGLVSDSDERLRVFDDPNWYQSFCTNSDQAQTSNTFLSEIGLAQQVIDSPYIKPKRKYYKGPFFRTYVAGQTEPVISGGVYIDPRDDQIHHAGFGIRVEPLAESMAKSGTLEFKQTEIIDVLRQKIAAQIA